MRRLGGLALMAFILSACALSADGGPDLAPGAGAVSPVITPLVPVEVLPTDTGLGYPLFQPSAADGARVFAERCASCHGFAGQGDGPMVARLLEQRPGPLPDFSSPALARSAAPAEWFDTITFGRLDKLMPPWGDTLTEAERWNLVAFLFTLSAPQDQIDVGQAVYAAQCAACHAAEGRGDGPEATSLGVTMPDFTDQAFMASRSQAELFASLMAGTGNAQHMFAEMLSEAERWAATDYARTFSYAYAAPARVPAGQARSVVGLVGNGTAGATLASPLTVVLHGYDGFAEAATVTATTDAAGAFRFDDVPFNPGRQYVLTAAHADVIYGSDIFAYALGQTEVAVPLTVYETTQDAAAVRVEQAHVFLEFTGQRLLVGELFIFSNDGDRTLWSPDGALEFQLPAGAANLTVQGGQEGVTYFRLPGGFADAAPVRPGRGSARVLFSFELPYAGRLAFEQRMPFPVRSANVLLPEGNVTVKGARLQPLGAQDIQGGRYQTYTAGELAQGDVLAFQLSGRPGAAAPVTLGEPQAVAVGAGAVALVVLGIGYWWFARRPGARGPEMSREDLLQAVADLDDAFDAGEFGAPEYDRRRRALMGALRQVWARDSEE